MPAKRSRATVSPDTRLSKKEGEQELPPKRHKPNGLFWFHPNIRTLTFHSALQLSTTKSTRQRSKMTLDEFEQELLLQRARDTPSLADADGKVRSVSLDIKQEDVSETPSPSRGVTRGADLKKDDEAVQAKSMGQRPSRTSVGPQSQDADDCAGSSKAVAGSSKAVAGSSKAVAGSSKAVGRATIAKCSLCHETGHNRRTCPMRGSDGQEVTPTVDEHDYDDSPTDSTFYA
ncbi:hypothetical protein BDZ89DRAFT_1048811 [Hymenopellis radicata]|nr:hypothetical protein BDZ89DRAFT_1048811 [Hymenopellis radicata]